MALPTYEFYRERGLYLQSLKNVNYLNNRTTEEATVKFEDREMVTSLRTASETNGNMWHSGVGFELEAEFPYLVANGKFTAKADFFGSIRRRLLIRRHMKTR